MESFLRPKFLLRMPYLYNVASTQPKEPGDICAENDREWSDFSIYLALPLEHCLSAEGASLREAAKISVCRKIVGTNVFAGHIFACSLNVCCHSLFFQIMLPNNSLFDKTLFSVQNNFLLEANYCQLLFVQKGWRGLVFLLG